MRVLTREEVIRKTCEKCGEEIIILIYEIDHEKKTILRCPECDKAFGVFREVYYKVK